MMNQIAVQGMNFLLRGPMIGTTFQGTLYDKNDRMAMTGTFMPAYGLNRIFKVVLDLITVKFMIGYSTSPMKLSSKPARMRTRKIPK